MEDSYQFIAAEAGTISPSQEEKLRCGRFIRQPPSSSHSSSAAEEEGAERFRAFAHTITMRSASDSFRSCSSAPEDHGDGEVNSLGDQVKGDRPGRQWEMLVRVSKMQAADAVGPSKEPRMGKRLCALSDESIQAPEVVRFSPMKPNGSTAELGLSGRHAEDGETVAGVDISKVVDVEERVLPAVAQNHAGRDDLAAAAVGNPKPSGQAATRLRKLPPHFQVPLDEGANARPGQSAQSSSPSSRNALDGESPEKLLPSESELINLLLKFSKNPDKRLENVDFLDVLAMKGIHIPPPRWWRPGGYGPC